MLFQSYHLPLISFNVVDLSTDFRQADRDAFIVRLQVNNTFITLLYDC